MYPLGLCSLLTIGILLERLGHFLRAARDLKGPMGDGFLLSSGCELPASTLAEDVAALVAALRD